MCCVCSLISKIISLIISLLFIVAVVLLILWAVGVLFNNDSSSNSGQWLPCTRQPGCDSQAAAASQAYDDIWEPAYLTAQKHQIVERGYWRRS